VTAAGALNAAVPADAVNGPSFGAVGEAAASAPSARPSSAASARAEAAAAGCSAMGAVAALRTLVALPATAADEPAWPAAELGVAACCVCWEPCAEPAPCGAGCVLLPDPAGLLGLVLRLVCWALAPVVAGAAEGVLLPDPAGVLRLVPRLVR
jgi:hypothetical protein